MTIIQAPVEQGRPILPGKNRGKLIHSFIGAFSKEFEIRCEQNSKIEEKKRSRDDMCIIEVVNMVS